jgi:hypothetical protein
LAQFVSAIDTGPILPILTYRSLDEAFGKIAATPHPLAAFVFSRDQKTIDRFIGELSYGGGAVNRTNIHLYIETMPFGGVGPAALIVADGDYVMLHGRFSGIGQPVNWVVADILRIENGLLAEHWDVIQDEATRESSKSGRPMFGDKFPA